MKKLQTNIPLLFLVFLSYLSFGQSMRIEMNSPPNNKIATDVIGLPDLDHIGITPPYYSVFWIYGDGNYKKDLRRANNTFIRSNSDRASYRSDYIYSLQRNDFIVNSYLTERYSNDRPPAYLSPQPVPMPPTYSNIPLGQEYVATTSIKHVAIDTNHMSIKNRKTVYVLKYRPKFPEGELYFFFDSKKEKIASGGFKYKPNKPDLSYLNSHPPNYDENIDESTRIKSISARKFDERQNFLTDFQSQFDSVIIYSLLPNEYNKVLNSGSINNENNPIRELRQFHIIKTAKLKTGDVYRFLAILVGPNNSRLTTPFPSHWTSNKTIDTLKTLMGDNLNQLINGKYYIDDYAFMNSEILLAHDPNRLCLNNYNKACKNAEFSFVYCNDGDPGSIGKVIKINIIDHDDEINNLKGCKYTGRFRGSNPIEDPDGNWTGKFDSLNLQSTKTLPPLTHNKTCGVFKFTADVTDIFIDKLNENQPFALEACAGFNGENVCTKIDSTCNFQQDMVPSEYFTTCDLSCNPNPPFKWWYVFLVFLIIIPWWWWRYRQRPGNS